MANNRDFKSLKIIASDAIPVTEEGFRTQGVAYRRTNLSDVQQIEGEPYDEPPITENINQKLYNQSSFTDFIDSTGILGWTNLVDYAPPAAVTASDGNWYLCLRSTGPTDNNVFDPVNDDPVNPTFWEVFENPTQLRIDLATSTPGNEGARRVNYNEYNINGGENKPLNTKFALDALLKGLNNFKNVEILASCNCLLRSDFNAPGVFKFQEYITIFNIDVGLTEDIVTPPSPFDVKSQGVRLFYINPLPANYIVVIKSTFQQSSFSHPNNLNQRSAHSYRNKATISIDFYGTTVNEQLSNTDPQYLLNFICYRII